MNTISPRLDSVPVPKWPLVTAGGCWGAPGPHLGAQLGTGTHGVCAVGKVRSQLINFAVP